MHEIFGQAVRKLPPRSAAVGGFEEAAVGAAVAVAVFPWALARFPKCGVEHVRILGIHFDVRAACVLIPVEDFFPGDAAVGGAKDSALFVWAVGMTEHGGEYAIWIARVNGERRNLLAVAQAEMHPSFSRVS